MARTPLILLHGALGSADTMASISSALHGVYDVYNPDLPGHGQHGASGFSTVAELVKYLNTYIEEHHLVKPIVFGYSLGGYVALSYSLTHSHRLSRIITFATKFDWNPGEAEKQVRMLNADVIETKVPAFAQILKARHGESYWKTVLTSTAQMMRQLGQQPILTIDTVSKISVPVYIAVGTEDQLVSREESQQIAEAIPNGKFRLLDGLPHAIEKISGASLARFIEECCMEQV